MMDDEGIAIVYIILSIIGSVAFFGTLVIKWFQDKERAVDIFFSAVINAFVFPIIAFIVGFVIWLIARALKKLNQ